MPEKERERESGFPFRRVTGTFTFVTLSRTIVSVAPLVALVRLCVLGATTTAEIRDKSTLFFRFMKNYKIARDLACYREHRVAINRSPISRSFAKVAPPKMADLHCRHSLYPRPRGLSSNTQRYVNNNVNNNARARARDARRGDRSIEKPRLIESSFASRQAVIFVRVE